MTIIAVLGIFIAGLVIGAVFLYFMSRRSEGMALLQGQVQDLVRMMDARLSESTHVMQNQFRESANIIRNVTEHLTRLDETNKQVINFTDQLQSLQDILKNPKNRGGLGGYYLETILENYNRLVEERDVPERDRLEKLFVSDLKTRIQETAKYIQPEKGTMDFAFMFIPHEAIYYDLLVNKVGALKEETENLIQRAASKYHVIIVSPTSFLAYLQTVLQALHAMKIEEKAQDIIKRVSDLGKHFRAYSEFHLKV